MTMPDATALLPGQASWEQADSQDIQQWMTWLMDHYSSAYASNRYRALQQFFKWLAAEDQLPDPMAGLQPPRVPDKLVPVFTSQELTRLDHACAGRSFAQRRDTAIIAVFTATGIRLSELADLRCSDVDLWQREITVRGKGGKDRTVRIGHQAARSLDRYQRSRSRHAQAWRPQLWLGADNREPLTAAGIYQMTARRGRQCGVDAYPHRFRHHFSHTWLDRGGPEGDLMELNGWASPQMLRRYGANTRSARARRTYDRIMTDTRRHGCVSRRRPLASPTKSHKSASRAAPTRTPFSGVRPGEVVNQPARRSLRLLPGDPSAGSGTPPAPWCTRRVPLCDTITGSSRPRAGAWSSRNRACWSSTPHPTAPIPSPLPSTRCGCRRAIPLPLAVDYVRCGRCRRWRVRETRWPQARQAAGPCGRRTPTASR